jgi:hypothetical protein
VDVSTSNWRQRLAPHEQLDLEISLLEAALRTQTGTEAEATKQQIAAFKRLRVREGHMTSSYTGKFQDAITRMSRDVAAGVNELRIFDSEIAEAQERGVKVPPSYIRDRRAKILQRIRENDAFVRGKLTDAQREAAIEAKRLRAAAEASRDPQARIADEMERARLAKSNTSADAFAAQARAALDAGQPRRAELLLGVALDKGYRGGFETDPATGETISTLPTLTRAISDALDTSEPDRQSARALEEAIEAATVEFTNARTTVLAQHAIGLTESGDIGSGETREVALASMSAKMRAFRAGNPEPEGVLASAPTGGTVRGKDTP